MDRLVFFCSGMVIMLFVKEDFSLYKMVGKWDYGYFVKMIRINGCRLIWVIIIK